MTAGSAPGPAQGSASVVLPRSPARLYAPLDAWVPGVRRVTQRTLGRCDPSGAGCEIRRYTYEGLPGGDLPIRLGLFAGIHGDEPAPAQALVRFLPRLEEDPELGRGYTLVVYPLCNPTGFRDGTRHSAAGLDLNREFWRLSSQPEVQLLEHELREQRFDGIIALHSDDTSHGVYGYVAGATLTELLIRPALREASQVLPLDPRDLIDGFQAHDAIIRSGYEGVLRAPPEQQPHPFEIILETPQLAPEPLQEEAFLRALAVILREYRALQAFAANL